MTSPEIDQTYLDEDTEITPPHIIETFLKEAYDAKGTSRSTRNYELQDSKKIIEPFIVRWGVDPIASLV